MATTNPTVRPSAASTADAGHSIVQLTIEPTAKEIIDWYRSQCTVLRIANGTAEKIGATKRTESLLIASILNDLIDHARNNYCRIVTDDHPFDVRSIDVMEQN